MNHRSALVVTNKCKEAGGSARIPANMDLYAGGKTATKAGLARLSRNPDSEVDQVPFHRQSLDIANANAFLSNFQRTVLRTLKFFAIDNPNQFFFAIFESLILKSANFLCTVKLSGRLLPPWFSLSEAKAIRQMWTFFPSMQIFKVYFETNRSLNRRRSIDIHLVREILSGSTSICHPERLLEYFYSDTIENILSLFRRFRYNILWLLRNPGHAVKTRGWSCSCSSSSRETTRTTLAPEPTYQLLSVQWWNLYFLHFNFIRFHVDCPPGVIGIWKFPVGWRGVEIETEIPSGNDFTLLWQNREHRNARR